MPPDTYLTGILATHRARAAADTRRLDDLVARALSCPPTRPFASRLSVPAGGELAVIAEVKRRSPSKGPIDLTLDPAQLAADYEGGGATCISVLTDEDYFAGSAQDLAAVRSACTLPVLRKDFTVCPADVCDARLMGADAVLLIVAALSDPELSSFLSLARELTLPEVTQTVILTRGAGRTPVPAHEALGELAKHAATMVIYLSIGLIDQVVAELTPSYGAEAQVVVAHRVSWPDQLIIRGTLADIAGRVRQAGIQRQALILVGPALADRPEGLKAHSKLYDQGFDHGFRSGNSD